MAGVLDFLENLLPTAGAVVGGIGGEALDAFGGGVAGASAGSAAGKALENKLQGKDIGGGVAGAAIGGGVGQGVGGLASGAIDAAAGSKLAEIGANSDDLGKILGKVTQGAVKGAAVGGAANTASSVAEGQPANPKDLGLDFLQGAATGAVTGGALEGGVQAFNQRIPLNQAGHIGNNPMPSQTEFSQDDLEKMAQSDNEKEVQKVLEEKIGPIKAQTLAPAIASDNTHDPAVVARMIDNELHQTLSPDSSVPAQTTPVVPQEAVQSPAPAPIPPTTPVSNVTTPTQEAGEATAASQSYNPQQEPSSNDLLNHFSNLRNQAGSDEDFYNNTILNNQETPGKVGQLSRSIARNVEGQGANISDELDDQLTPLSTDELSGNVTPDKDAQLNDLKMTARKLEKDTGQTGLYSNLAKNMADMNQDEQIAYLSKGLTAARDSGAMAATHIGVQPSTQPATPEQARSGVAALQPFINAPGEQAAPGSVSKLGAVTGMHDIVNSGGTVDEALNHYMETTGGGYGEAQDQFNKLLGESGPNSSLQRGNINASLNPEFENAKKLIPTAQENDHEQPVKNAKMVQNEVVRRGNAALAEVDKLAPEDLKLMDYTRNTDPKQLASQAKDPDQFIKAAETVKKYNDFTQGVGSGALGQDVAYRQNYGAPLLFDQSPESQQALQVAQAKLATTPGYGKSRTLNSYDDAPDVPRQNENFMGDLASDIGRRANDLGQLTLAKGLNEAYPGQLKVGQIGSGAEGTYKQLLIPGGQKLSMPSDIADEINRRAPAPDARGLLKGYDTLNSNWKNLKLAGGGFHSVNVMGTYIAQQLASGNFLSDPGSISGMIKATFSDNAFKEDVGNWEKSGRLLDMDAAGLTHQMNETQADIKPSGKLGNIPVLKQIHSAIFERQIPYMKMRIFDQETQGLDRNNPEDLQQMTKIAKQLNQNFGGLNRSIQGFTPSSFKQLSRVFLATDYNEGQIRTLADAFSKSGAEGKLARQVVFGKALLFAGAATLGGMAGGEFKGKTPSQVAFDILHKTIDPQFQIGGYTVGLPTTQASELGKPLAETIGNAVSGKSLQNPTKDFLSARLAAVPSGVEQLAGNRNFSGNPIYGTDYYGRPISPTQTASTIAGMAAPIPLAQGAQTANGQQNVGAAIANTVGVRAAPTNSIEYSPIAGQTYLSELAKTPGVTKDQVSADTQFFEALGAGDEGRSKVLKQAIGDVAKHDNASAEKVINSYNKQLAQALQPWASSANARYLDSSMLEILSNTMIKMKTATSDSSYDVKTNPTAYGVPIQALASTPTTVGNNQGGTQ